MKLKIVLLVGIAMLVLTASRLTYGQTQSPPKEEQKVDAKSPYRVVIFDVKHQSAEALARALVGSGAPGTQIIPNRELKTITVRDYPENILVIGEAIKRFDVPSAFVAPKIRESLDFQLQLIAASQTPSEKTAMPPSLEKVVQQLKATLKYTDYRFLTTIACRVINDGTVTGNGYISPPFPSAGINVRSNYDYNIQGVRLVSDAAGNEAIHITRFKFTLAVPIVNSTTGNPTQLQGVGLNTELSLREGESAVVGTANVGGSDEAIIVVVTARKMK